MLNESYVCTSLNDSGDSRMKPNPGMILEACQNEKVAKVSPNKSVMIGDSLSDLQAAQAGGISRKILVSIGASNATMSLAQLDPCIFIFSPLARLRIRLVTHGRGDTER